MTTYVVHLGFTPIELICNRLNLDRLRTTFINYSDLNIPPQKLKRFEPSDKIILLHYKQYMRYSCPSHSGYYNNNVIVVDWDDALAWG